jgi:hypothetical protein
LLAGDAVRVKSERAILATLDENGARDGLPFMPEMLRLCGARATVESRADKTCDTISVNAKGLRRLGNAVHLQGVRCDGEAHGGCQAACLVFWHEDWLEPDDGTPAHPSGAQTLETTTGDGAGAGLSRDALYASTRVDTGTSDEPVYVCQATALHHASSHLPWWDVRQYWNDLVTRNVAPSRMLNGLAILLFNKLQAANVKYLPSRPLIRGGRKYPFVHGRAIKTPSQTLDLKPGERVRIKSLPEIEKTINARRENRGLSFDREMVPYCSSRARVLQRVERIVDEKTGRMLRLESGCIILEGVVCRGDFHEFCPRSIYPYWREVWLERVE